MPCYDGRESDRVRTVQNPIDDLLLTKINVLTRLLCTQVKEIGVENCIEDVQNWYKCHEKDSGHES